MSDDFSTIINLSMNIILNEMLAGTVLVKGNSNDPQDPVEGSLAFPGIIDSRQDPVKESPRMSPMCRPFFHVKGLQGIPDRVARDPRLSYTQTSLLVRFNHTMYVFFTICRIVGSYKHFSLLLKILYYFFLFLRIWLILENILLVCCYSIHRTHYLQRLQYSKYRFQIIRKFK